MFENGAADGTVSAMTTALSDDHLYVSMQSGHATEGGGEMTFGDTSQPYENIRLTL